MPLRVDNADVTGLKITMDPYPQVTGRVTIEGDKRITLHHGSVRFGFGNRGVSINSDNTFASAMTPDHYMIGVSGDEMKNDLVIKSIRMEQTDLLRDEIMLRPGTTVHLDIVLAPDGGQIDGTALDKDEKPVAGATVIAIPEPSLRTRPDRFYQASTDQNGRYGLKNAAPGNYKIFAWDDVEPGVWFDPDYLREIEAQGQAITLQANGHESAQVHIIAR